MEKASNDFVDYRVGSGSSSDWRTSLQINDRIPTQYNRLSVAAFNSNRASCETPFLILYSTARIASEVTTYMRASNRPSHLCMGCDMYGVVLTQ